MASLIGWLDYSEEQRQQMREIIDLFRDEDSIDELGIGAIRDTFADILFPGLSTVQTRARYFLLVPWVYQRLEREKVPSRRASAKARDLMYDLVKAMKAGGVEGGQGIIGWDAGRDVQRLPSAIYWTGLRIFGIRQFVGSIQEYHRSFDSYHERLRQFDRGEGDEAADRFHPNWTPQLPHPPKDLWKETTIELQRDEARFLATQITLYCPDSLLAHLVENPAGDLSGIASPWLHPAAPGAEETTRVVLGHSRLFAVVMQGAAFAYNLMLAESAANAGIDIGANDLEDRYEAALEEWLAAIEQDPAMRSWNLSELWTVLSEHNPRIPRTAIAFAETWIQHAQQNLEEIATLSPRIRNLISDRERRLKRGKARLHNRRALEMWSGASGTALLSYRWPTARTLLADIHGGLDGA